MSFQDPDFEHFSEFRGRKITWKRPRDLVDTPKFIDFENLELENVKTGKLEDYWFLDSIDLNIKSISILSDSTFNMLTIDINIKRVNSCCVKCNFVIFITKTELTTATSCFHIRF